MIEAGWLVTGLLMLVLAIAGYVLYVKVRAGQQPGEAFIDAMIAKITKERAKGSDVTNVAGTGPLPVLDASMGDLAHVARSDGAYRNSTGRDLWPDLFTGSADEIERMREVGRSLQDAPALPHSPSLQGVIDTLVQRHRR